MRINIEIGEIQAFIAVADKSSFKAAAESLFISQPALSRRIEKLELELKARLLARTTRRVSLTDAGRQFLAHARAVTDELQLAYQGMEAKAVARTGLITIACVPSVANHLLPSVLKTFALTYPEVRIKVIDESAQVVLESVLHGHADFGLNFLGSQEADLEFTPIRAEPYVVVVPQGHRLAHRKSVRWDALQNERLVSVSRSSGNRLLIDHALNHIAQRPPIQYEINHVTGAIQLVAAGLGVAIVPGLAVNKDLAAGLVGIPLTDPAMSRTLGLVMRKGDRLHETAQVLADTLVQSIRTPQRQAVRST